MTDSAIDRKSIRAREKAAAVADRLRAEVITSVMSTSAGRQWIWDTLTTCHVFATTFTGDPLTTAFAEGERNIGLRLISDIMLACPDQYLTAQRESNDRNLAHERRSSPEPDGGDPGSVDPSPFDSDAERAYFDYTDDPGR